MCIATLKFCRVSFQIQGGICPTQPLKETQQPLLQILASLHLITKSSSCPAVEEVQDYARGQTPSFC